MNLIKTSLLSGIETAIKMASAFVVMKYISLIGGREGLALFGQFYNFIALFVALLSGGFTVGLVRYCSQAENKTYLANALGLGLMLSLFFALTVILLANDLSNLIFHTDMYKSLFYILGLSSFFITFYQIMIAALNGFGALNKLIFCKTSASTILLMTAIILVYYFGVMGGFISLILTQALPVVIGLWAFTRIEGFQWTWLKPQFQWAKCRDFFPFWFMGFVTLIASPLMIMLVRTHIVHHGGWDEAGLWEASWKISELYLLVITTALTTYYVPKLSRVLDTEEEGFVVKELLFWGSSAAALLAMTIFGFKDLIIPFLFSDDFLPVSQIILFQLLGSVIKIGSWVIAYFFLIKKKMVLFVFGELFFGATFYLFSVGFYNHFGLLGLSYAFFLNYLLYFFFYLFYFIQAKGWKILFIRDGKAIDKEKEIKVCKP